MLLERLLISAGRGLYGVRNVAVQHAVNSQVLTAYQLRLAHLDSDFLLVAASELKGDLLILKDLTVMMPSPIEQTADCPGLPSHLPWSRRHHCQEP